MTLPFWSQAKKVSGKRKTNQTGELKSDEILDNPRLQYSVVAGASLEVGNQESMRLNIVYGQFPAIQAKEDICRKECNSLVAVYECMVEEQGFEKRRGHRCKIIVVAGLGAIKRAFEQALIANACRSAEAFDESFVDGDDFIDGQKFNSVTLQAGGRALRFLLSRLPGGPTPPGEPGAV
ncbi:MAG: hypothetical protein WBM68_00185 [Woeseia sp.]